MVWLITILMVFAFLSPIHAYEKEKKLRIGGSSTVFPFASVVAERLSDKGFSDIVVESIGTGSGFKLFCKKSENSLDIANASRRMSLKEFRMCSKAGVVGIIELKIGYDGVTIVKLQDRNEALRLTPRALFLALAREVPSESGDSMVPNGYKYWSEISMDYPKHRIKFFGPPTTSGTRDSFVELVMRFGARVVLPSGSDIKAAAANFRQDGTYVSVGESDNLILKKLTLRGNENAMGILGFSYFDQNRDVLQAQYFEGSLPLFENILSGDYKISRSLYMYVKISSLEGNRASRAYIEELFSGQAMGPYGYLRGKGLVPVSEAERDKIKYKVRSKIPVLQRDLK